MPPSRLPTVDSGGGTRTRLRFWFRIVAALAPVVVLLTVETVLRMRGSYRETRYWVPASPGEIMPNPAFATRFVGPSMARMPRSVRVPVQKPESALRIVFFGESAALGDPEPAFGVSRFLQALLEARLPGRRVEVINTAITALNSHAIRDVARDSVSLKADYWIFYAGNNEVIGPYGPASVSGTQPPGLAAIRFSLAGGRTAIGQWIADQRALKTDGLTLTQRWAGLEMFLDRPITAGDPRLSTVRDYFGRNLEDAVEVGLRSGSRVLLSTMAVNLLDCPPLAGPGAIDTNSPAGGKWAAARARAVQAGDRGDFADAVTAWTEAADLHPEDAETRYQLGLAKVMAGDATGGRQDLELARDLDPLRFRADSGINDSIRSLARRRASEGILFVDADAELHLPESLQPPGIDLFLEHVHLRPEGNYLLARLFAEQILRNLGTPGGTSDWASLETCLARLGWTPFAEARLWNQARTLTQRPPFSRQSNALARERYFDDRLADANVAARQLGLASAISNVQTQVMSHPDDWQLREQFARLLQSARQASNAAVQWREIVAAAPAHVVGWYQLGESLAQLGEFNPAREAYQRALSIRPDFVEARLGLGLAEAQAGLTQEALRSFEDILAFAPQHLQARVNHGLVLIKSGQVEAGEADLRKAAAENTNSIVPLVRLAESLSGRKDYPAAAVAYGDAIQRDPRNPALHHRQAIELSRAGWASEADAAFARALQADPNFVSARIDYGVALAQRGQFPSAISEFETVLRQQPTNSLAQTYLKMAQEKLTQTGQPNAPR